MNVLTVDIGNSRVKIDIWNESGHLYHEVAEKLNPSFISRIINLYDIEGASFCAVGKESDETYRSAYEMLKGNVSYFTTENSFCKEIFETYNGRLGADRAAACLGAVSLFPSTPIMIVDAGTAMTIDVVNADGIFCGGNISLGVKSRLRALHDFTKLLPEVEADRHINHFGNNTISAMKSGALTGCVAEILYDLGNAKKEYNVNTLILTGGDANLLLPFIEKSATDIVHDPYLVSRGLNVDFRNQHSITNQTLCYETT